MSETLLPARVRDGAQALIDADISPDVTSFAEDARHLADLFESSGREDPCCQACGGTHDLAYRGWHDEGDPMLTCVNCGAPE